MSRRLSRREALEALGLAAAAAAFDWTPAQAGQAALRVQAARAAEGAPPSFFTPHEFDTVQLLADLIIPKDARSGSATDVGTHAFIDFVMADGTDNQRIAMRGGLAWIDVQCRKRFAGQTFLECADSERAALLDDIAWPAKAPADMSQGVAFFNSFRDLTAAGFFSSKMGIEDLQYQGNTFVSAWNGCPPEALAKLGVRYGR